MQFEQLPTLTRNAVDNRQWIGSGWDTIRCRDVRQNKIGSKKKVKLYFVVFVLKKKKTVIFLVLAVEKPNDNPGWRLRTANHNGDLSQCPGRETVVAKRSQVYRCAAKSRLKVADHVAARYSWKTRVRHRRPTPSTEPSPPPPPPPPNPSSIGDRYSPFDCYCCSYKLWLLFIYI